MMKDTQAVYKYDEGHRGRVYISIIIYYELICPTLYSLVTSPHMGTLNELNALPDLLQIHLLNS